MALDIWFSEDIRNALLAANEASAATAAVITEADTTELLAVSLRAYMEGYRAALTTVALAFGLTPAAISRSDHATPTALAWAGKDRAMSIRKTTERPETG